MQPYPIFSDLKPPSYKLSYPKSSTNLATPSHALELFQYQLNDSRLTAPRSPHVTFFWSLMNLQTTKHITLIVLFKLIESSSISSLNLVEHELFKFYVCSWSPCTLKHISNHKARSNLNTLLKHHNARSKQATRGTIISTIFPFLMFGNPFIKLVKLNESKSTI